MITLKAVLSFSRLASWLRRLDYHPPVRSERRCGSYNSPSGAATHALPSTMKNRDDLNARWV